MRIAIRLALLCGLVLASVSAAEARGRGPRGGVVMGPNGPLYDTRSPEWQMSGGDMNAYQAIMQQKMMMQQQKYMMQQMQQMQKAAQLQKNQANGKGKSKTNAGVFGQPGTLNFNSSGASGFNNPYAEPVNHYHRKTYNHGTVDPKARPRTNAAK